MKLSLEEMRSMTSKILALDLGSTFGYANFDGCWSAGSTRLTGARRAAKLLDLFSHLCLRSSPDYVIFERPFTRGIHATRMLWGMAGIVEMWAEGRGIACVDQAPLAIKKWATGSGKADKDAMIAEATKRGYPGLDEHAADALLLGMYAQEVVVKG